MGTRTCSFVMAKTCLAPLKALTIARLELQAATLAVRLFNTIKNEMDIKVSTVRFWTDSKMTLQYIRNHSKQLKTFVSNRVAEIHEHSDPQNWFHIDGKENPADDCTRGLHPSKISANSRWLCSPEFLYKGEENVCFQHNQIYDELAEDDPEIRKEKLTISVTSVSHAFPVDISRFLSWNHLTIMTAFVIIAYNLFKMKNTLKRENDTVRSSHRGSTLRVGKEKGGITDNIIPQPTDSELEAATKVFV